MKFWGLKMGTAREHAQVDAETDGRTDGKVAVSETLDLDSPRELDHAYVHVVGCRPNFVKLAAVYPHLGGVVLHTGQHYDDNMSDVFFAQLQLPSPNGDLSKLSALRPKWVIVYGDTRSTLEGTVAAKHYGLRVAHVEAGLRCGDMEMPEEINRRCVDLLADLLFAPSQDAIENLKTERLAHKAHLVGNVMIDTLAKTRPRYAVLTLHRPANVDEGTKLRKILEELERIEIAFKFPVHPRTQKNLPPLSKNVWPQEPLPYKEFIELVAGAHFVVTDSGGIQEECVYLNVPCFTVRPSTERPVTLGVNRLVVDPSTLACEVNRLLSADPKFWDGQAGERIARILREAV